MSSARQLPSYQFEIYQVRNKQGNFDLRFALHVPEPRIKTVVLQGGGGRCVPLVAFLEEIEYIRNDIRQFGGSSAGAFFSILAAIPMDPIKRTDLIASIEISKDILDESVYSKIYRILTAPLYLVSKPLSLVEKIFGWTAEKCYQNPITTPLGWLLSAVSGIFQMASVITHPLFFAGAYNLLFKGGIYRGDKYQQQMRDKIHYHALEGIEDLINQANAECREQIIKELTEIPNLVSDIKIQNDSTVSVRLQSKEITFEHFHLLSEIKGSGFKKIFIIAAKNGVPEDQIMTVFDYKNSPQMTLHEAARHSMAIPLIYQLRKDNTGSSYADGACVASLPVAQATQIHEPKDAIAARWHYGIHGQDLSVLAVELCNKAGLLDSFLPENTDISIVKQISNSILKYLYKKITGIDIMEYYEKERVLLKNLYPLRTLKLYHHDRPITRFDVSEEEKINIVESEKPRVREYFTLHNYAALSHTQHYHSLSSEYEEKSENQAMPLEMQSYFLACLRDNAIHNDELFREIPVEENIPEVKRKKLREELIIKLEENLSLAKQYTASTPYIMQQISLHNGDHKKYQSSDESKLEADSSSTPIHYDFIENGSSKSTPEIDEFPEVRSRITQ